MSDGGGIFGVLTLLCICGGVVAYQIAVDRMKRRPHPSPPRVGERPDFRAILDAQARAAEARRERISYEGYTLDQWLDAFAKRLAELWRIDRAEARRLGREWLGICGMRFPDPAYDWSLRAAVEMAEEYARENGEEYGANG